MKNFSALTKSLIFHGLVVVLVSGAFLFKDDMIVSEETAIEIAFVTDSTLRSETKKPVTVKDEPPPSPPAEDKPIPAPQALEQPDIKPKPIDKEKQVKEVEKQVERITANEPEPEPEPVPEKPKDKPKPKPEPKKEEVKEVKPEKPKEVDTKTGLESLLKNLADTQPTDTQRDGPKLTEAPVSDPVTSGEINALNRQIGRCWRLLPGAAQADSLAVNLTINVNQNRTVRDVQIADRARYSRDPFFRAAADNAIRAIKHPDCTPLDLPPNKYNEWKVIDMNFDPQNMF